MAAAHDTTSPGRERRWYRVGLALVKPRTAMRLPRGGPDHEVNELDKDRGRLGRSGSRDGAAAW